MPVKDSYSCVVPLISLVNGDILQRTLFEKYLHCMGQTKMPTNAVALMIRKQSVKLSC